MSVNKVILVGNVGKDPEIRNLQGGAKVATITLATTEKFKDREETEWHTVTIWNNLAEVAEKYVKKGSQLYIEGRIKTEKFTGKDGVDKYATRIVASSMQLLGKRDSSSPAEPSPAPQQRVPLYQQATQMPAAPEPTDDLPF
jgi:single-strand DNA-binding protein